jgi:hypothetical protein
VKKIETMENPIVTIGIPVMPDREYYIDKCLQSVLAQTYSDSYEIIIAQHPGFNYRVKMDNLPEQVSIKLLASGASLSSKRNAIMEHAKGKYILNIDDDVIPEPDWLENMVHAAIENDYDVFWGLARPIYEIEFPENLDPFEMLIGGFHYDRKGRLRRKGLIGCNFGFRKGLNHKRGKFVEDIGRGGTAAQDGEETLFVIECIGPRMGAVQNAIVNHYIQPERINFSYILRNRCSNVKSSILMNNITGVGNLDLLRERTKEIIKAFRPRRHMFKTVILEGCLLTTTVLSIILAYFCKSKVDVD